MIILTYDDIDSIAILGIASNIEKAKEMIQEHFEQWGIKEIVKEPNYFLVVVEYNINYYVKITHCQLNEAISDVWA